ncbi:hypothetical protein [Paractinoplanes hotanensis]|uniref:Uncharacterized protein n=1 Tax=Paractinoplanes hotanensis TaxID=2906497 RepID=A0ABT0YI89_9ACTN|nr:hypothetical protein [Actinoplanes hotanensis]MCM4085202.1 hypothetical protein [Actinoplanes hotanensis]MDY7090954.1 hypothetical protein [Actinomycetota bacterium]
MHNEQPATRNCPTCQNPLPGNNPRRRYCSPPCKAEGWRRDHPDDTDTDRIVIPRKTPTPPPATTLRDCPHCGEPVAIVALLATPAAAQVDTPHTIP